MHNDEGEHHDDIQPRVMPDQGADNVYRMLKHNERSYQRFPYTREAVSIDQHVGTSATIPSTRTPGSSLPHMRNQTHLPIGSERGPDLCRAAGADFCRGAGAGRDRAGR
jgi:hypothetical protein